MNLICIIKLKTIKTLKKKPRKTIRKSKENGPSWNHYYHWKNKNHKLDLNDQITSHKNFLKRAKKNKLRN
jgi:hypothetical protein